MLGTSEMLGPIPPIVNTTTTSASLHRPGGRRTGRWLHTPRASRHQRHSIGFVPSAVVHYRVKDTARGIVRQRLGYGAGYQRLVAKAVQLGIIQMAPTRRWRSVAVDAATMARRLPGTLDARKRLLYLSDVAYLAGQVGRLTVERALLR